MQKYIIKDDTMTGIGDAIRSKTNETELIPVTQMAQKISSIRTYEEPVLEGVTIKPTGSEIVKVPPTGVDGFGIVTVEGDPNLLPENIREGETVYGVVGTHSDGIDTSDATATQSDISEGATAYVNGVKITGTHTCPPDPILAPLIVDPTGEKFTRTPDDGEDGFSEVTVEGDSNLIPENIKKDVVVYGVTGELVDKQLYEESVTPGSQDIVLVPDEGYDGFSKVTVFGISGSGSGSGSGPGSGGSSGTTGDMFIVDIINFGDTVLNFNPIVGTVEVIS